MTRKAIALTLLAALGLLSTGGCSTPAYSAKERWRLISRNWGYEWQQTQDDIDKALLLRPSGRLSIWTIR